MERTIRIYTGAGGYDLFNEIMGNQLGYERIYIGKKVLRLIRRIDINIKKSASGRFYRTKKMVP